MRAEGMAFVVGLHQPLMEVPVPVPAENAHASSTSRVINVPRVISGKVLKQRNRELLDMDRVTETGLDTSCHPH
ncbi:hypothetical protein ACFQBU_17865 [Jhaorihella thermophila]